MPCSGEREMWIHPEDPTVERIVDHVCYVADRVGIDHVGIGERYRLVTILEVTRAGAGLRWMMDSGGSDGVVVRCDGGVQVYRS